MRSTNESRPHSASASIEPIRISSRCSCVPGGVRGRRMTTPGRPGRLVRRSCVSWAFTRAPWVPSRRGTRGPSGCVARLVRGMDPRGMRVRCACSVHAARPGAGCPAAAGTGNSALGSGSPRCRALPVIGILIRPRRIAGTAPEPSSFEGTERLKKVTVGSSGFEPETFTVSR